MSAIYLYLIILLLIILIVAGRLRQMLYGSIDRHTVSELDVERYMGIWYEIARFDNRFERGLSNVTSQLRMIDGGAIEVVNSGINSRTGNINRTIVKAKKSKHTGRLRVNFFGPFLSNYNIMELDHNYQWAMVGSHSHHYLWILSRTPTLDHDILVGLCLKAEQRGYHTEELRFVDQSRHL